MFDLLMSNARLVLRKNGFNIKPSLKQANVVDWNWSNKVHEKQY